MKVIKKSLGHHLSPLKAVNVCTGDSPAGLWLLMLAWENAEGKAASVSRVCAVCRPIRITHHDRRLLQAEWVLILIASLNTMSWIMLPEGVVPPTGYDSPSHKWCHVVLFFFFFLTDAFHFALICLKTRFINNHFRQVDRILKNEGTVGMMPIALLLMLIKPNPK